MGRTRRKFTEDEVWILAKNPYTYRVTDSTIRFTLSKRTPAEPQSARRGIASTSYSFSCSPFVVNYLVRSIHSVCVSADVVHYHQEHERYHDPTCNDTLEKFHQGEVMWQICLFF